MKPRRVSRTTTTRCRISKKLKLVKREKIGYLEEYGKKKK
jgi:hypothetical protein